MVSPAPPSLIICCLAWLRYECLPALARRIGQATAPAIEAQAAAGNEYA
jgi:hypothetical protein